MLKKETFLHYQTGGGRSLGFSAIMVPIDPLEIKPNYDEEGHLLVNFGVTFCNPKDKHFNKKIARAQLRSITLRQVRVIDLPTLLAHCADQAWGDKVMYNSPSNFDFLLKTFV